MLFCVFIDCILLYSLSKMTGQRMNRKQRDNLKSDRDRELEREREKREREMSLETEARIKSRLNVSSLLLLFLMKYIGRGEGNFQFYEENKNSLLCPACTIHCSFQC